MTNVTRLVDGKALTKERFATPPLELGIVPFWFWNGELDESELERQLREYYDKGVRSVFIHGRFGLKVPYLSHEWFQRVKYAVKKGREIGVDLWIYDEMNWPSGTAGREVPKKYPHLSQKYLELVVLDIDGPIFTFLEATDTRYVNTGNAKPVAAFACSAEQFESGITDLIDLTPNLSFERVIPWEAPAGKWKLLYFLEKEIDYYIDALNPESTARFLQMTHEEYKKAVGEEFGKTVPGFFTDEPAMLYYQVGVDNYVLPWSNKMFKIFRERRGYHLKPFLPALFTSMGDTTAQVRYDFYRTLTEQYSESFYKQIRKWCEANGLLLTGHLLFEEWLRLLGRCEGNVFEHLKNLHIIGVDHLYPKIGTPDEPDQHVALKTGSSAAHHFGSPRVLCESMGGTYWDCTLQRMKWMANWEYVLGINLFNNHGYHYSIEGDRKRDWPPSQFYHHPWWKHYRCFTDYMARLGYLLSGGRHVAKILILYPMNSIWTNYVPQSRNEIGNVIESDFLYLTDTLMRLHYDFDYVDEDVLAQAGIDEGEIHIKDESYSLLIVPPVTHLKRSTFGQIESFVASGGNVIADTLLPVAFLDADQPGAVTEVERVFGVNPTQMLASLGSGGGLRVSHQRSSGNVYVIQGSGLSKERDSGELDRLIRACIDPDVTIDDSDVFYLHRIRPGRHIYFFVNTTQENKQKVQITLESAGSPELWDPNTGEVRPLWVHDVRDGRLVFELSFPPGESRIVAVEEERSASRIIRTNLDVEGFDGKSIDGYARVDNGKIYGEIETGARQKILTAPARRPLPPVSLGPEFRFRITGDNVLCIDRWKMTIDDGSERLAEFHGSDFDDDDWLTVTRGAWELQLPEERDETTYPVTLLYRIGFHANYRPSSTRILIDGFRGSGYTLYINGHRVKGQGTQSSLDAEIKELDIQPFIREGENTIAVRLTAEGPTDGLLDLLKIVGDFSLDLDGEDYWIIQPKDSISVGDWTSQGYPCYSGTGVYETEFEMGREYLDGRVLLEVDCGEDVLEVDVNESEGIVFPWHPYRKDITRLLQAGRNTITLKVTNTSINILEGVHKKSGILSEPRLVHERRYTLSPGK